MKRSYLKWWQWRLTQHWSSYSVTHDRKTPHRSCNVIVSQIKPPPPRTHTHTHTSRHGVTTCFPPHCSATETSQIDCGTLADERKANKVLASGRTQHLSTGLRRHNKNNIQNPIKSVQRRPEVSISVNFNSAGCNTIREKSDFIDSSFSSALSVLVGINQSVFFISYNWQVQTDVNMI